MEILVNLDDSLDNIVAKVTKLKKEQEEKQLKFVTKCGREFKINGKTDKKTGVIDIVSKLGKVDKDFNIVGTFYKEDIEGFIEFLSKVKTLLN